MWLARRRQEKGKAKVKVKVKVKVKAALPSGFSGGAGKAEQWKGESALGKSGRS